MWNIKDIMKIGVCSLCENIYEYNSLEENEFLNFLDIFLIEEDLDECLERSTDGVTYDIENIENIYENNSNKYKNYTTDELKVICKIAFKKTIEENKTINVEAFIDNIIKEVKKITK